MGLNNNVKLKISSIPLLVLLAMVVIPLPFYFLFNFNYFYYMPVIFFIAGFFVIIIGAWYDFGAKTYLSTVFKSGAHFEDSDIDYIYKQQFIMTVIYIGIGALYMTTGYMIFLI